MIRIIERKCLNISQVKGSKSAGNIFLQIFGRFDSCRVLIVVHFVDSGVLRAKHVKLSAKRVGFKKKQNKKKQADPTTFYRGMMQNL